MPWGKVPVFRVTFGTLVWRAVLVKIIPQSPPIASAMPARLSDRSRPGRARSRFTISRFKGTPPRGLALQLKIRRPIHFKAGRSVSNRPVLFQAVNGAEKLAAVLRLE
jgi:hypothetical protein